MTKSNNNTTDDQLMVLHCEALVLLGPSPHGKVNFGGLFKARWSKSVVTSWVHNNKPTTPAGGGDVPSLAQRSPMNVCDDRNPHALNSQPKFWALKNVLQWASNEMSHTPRWTGVCTKNNFLIKHQQLSWSNIDAWPPGLTSSLSGSSSRCCCFLPCSSRVSPPQMD